MVLILENKTLAHMKIAFTLHETTIWPRKNLVETNSEQQFTKKILSYLSSLSHLYLTK
jgi:hypothetical protein